MRKHLQAKIGIAITSVALILSILAFSFINGSVAWFSGRAEVDASGLSVTVGYELKAKISITSHPVTTIEGNAYTIDSDETATELPLYDPESIVPSAYERAIAVIVTIEPMETTTLSLSLLAAMDENSVVSTNNWISNCLSIKEASLAGNIATSAGNSHNFLTVGSETHSKTLEIALLENHLFSGTEQFCYIIEYDVALLEYIADRVLQENPDADTITYQNDIKFWAHG